MHIQYLIYIISNNQQQSNPWTAPKYKPPSGGNLPAYYTKNTSIAVPNEASSMLNIYFLCLLPPWV